jgi:hypothetical protein
MQDLVTLLYNERKGLAYSLILKMKATWSSETSVCFQRNTRHYIPEARTLQKSRSFKKYINKWEHYIIGRKSDILITVHMHVCKEYELTLCSSTAGRMLMEQFSLWTAYSFLGIRLLKRRFLNQLQALSRDEFVQVTFGVPLQKLCKAAEFRTFTGLFTFTQCLINLFHGTEA